MWPTAFALTKLTAADEARIVALEPSCQEARGREPMRERVPCPGVQGYSISVRSMPAVDVEYSTEPRPAR
jgi:hypothetical protein